ncbi:MAG: UDP-N-acetylmuramoyl-tripeptide--D-alanyl-D-alanine ligase [bacterium]
MKKTFKKVIIYILKIESQLVLSKYKPKIIAVTGSVGKTSTKDAVYAVLSKISHVRKSEKSFNSEIGLPLTILGVRNGWNNPLSWLLNILKGLWLFLSPLGFHQYPQWLVLEVGIGKPDDMRKTAAWLKTDVVIMTAIGDTPSHVEFFNSHKHLIEEKSQLIRTLKKDGILILNADDKTILEMKEKSKNHTITYGFTTGADVLGSGDAIFYSENNEPAGVIFRVDERGNSFPVVIEKVFGRNHVYATLSALALASGLKFNMLTAINALKNYEVAPGRMRLLKGIKNCLIIDDTYNSSPFACESALQTLGEIKNKNRKGRKVAILGDMLELGRHTLPAHKNIGQMAKEILSENTDVLMVVGPRAQGIKEGAIENGMKIENIFEFLDSREAGNFVKTFVQPNDLILVKGSQGMRMERVVGEILLDQENKNKLLVRQDKEWLEKN